MESWENRCRDCISLIELQNGKWGCDECNGQLCKNIKECPEGVLLENISEVRK